MSFFRKLVGGDPHALIRKADALLAEGDPGSAKLAYEKACGLLPENERAPYQQKVHDCKDAIARERTRVGDGHAAHGDMDLAIQEWVGAVEVAHADDVRAEAQRKLDTLEQQDAVEQAVSHDMTDEERLTLMAGQWEETQADEYEAHGDGVFDALVLLHKESFSEAREMLEAIVSAPDASPRYLWLEIGRARLLTDDVAGGEEALQAFLGALGPGEGGEAQLQARLELARIADDAGDADKAMAHMEGAIEALPEDYRAYLAMGAYLRQKEHPTEAIEVLETARNVATTTSPDWRLLQELGLAHHDAGQRAKAIGYLEQVIAFFTQHQVTDFPPPTAVALATAFEQDGKPERAADMYRALSDGSDTANHALYHYEAGRLLSETGLADEAHRMLTRAEALAVAGGGTDSDSSPEDLLAKIRELL